MEVSTRDRLFLYLISSSLCLFLQQPLSLYLSISLSLFNECLAQEDPEFISGQDREVCLPRALMQKQCTPQGKRLQRKRGCTIMKSAAEALLRSRALGRCSWICNLICRQTLPLSSP